MSFAHVHRGDDWQALASIYQPNINGSVAQNMMALLGDSTALTEAIQRLQTTLHSPDIRLHCALDDLPQALIDALPTGNGMANWHAPYTPSATPFARCLSATRWRCVYRV